MTELVCDVKIIKIDTLPDNFYNDFNINDLKEKSAPRKAILTFTNNTIYFIYYAALKRNMGVCGKLFDSNDIFIGNIRNGNLDNDIIVNNIVSLNHICNILALRGPLCGSCMSQLLVFTNTVDINNEILMHITAKQSSLCAILFLDNDVRDFISVKKNKDHTYNFYTVKY